MKRIGSVCVLLLAIVCITCQSPVVFARSLWKVKTIMGRVIDEETKLPLVAELSVWAEGFSPIKAMTDSTGYFSVAVPEATQCKIVVSAKGFDSTEETIVITESSLNYFEIRMTPKVKLTMDGMVFGRVENNEYPVDAKLTVYLNSDFIKEDSVTVVSGKYSESFTNFGWYIIDFSAPGFADARDTIWVMNNHRKNIHKDYHLVPLDSKLSIALTNIHFKFASSTLEPDAFVELDYLSDFLNHNLTKQVKIIGHTDNTGSSEYNLLLSEARARSAVKYLTAKGVKSNQLVTIGYGEEKPVDLSNTADGKANNRSVELVLCDIPTATETSITDFKSIHFDFGMAKIRQDSYAELDRLAKFIASEISVSMEVAGHTDSIGPKDYNNFLSQARAQAVVDYLKSKGVNGDRLVAKGYGDTKPIDSNTTATGKANNRRVELTVLSDNVQASLKNQQ